MDFAPLRRRMPDRRTTPWQAVFLLLLGACSGEGDDIETVLRDPGALRGRNPDNIQALFGEPEFRRRDGTAQVWQYSADICFLDLFFYPQKDAEAPAFVVTHYEIRNKGDQAVTSRACLATIAANKE